MPRIVKINHIGLATQGIREALELFSEGLGLPVSGFEDVPGDGVRVAFLPLGESRLEMLEPLGESGPLHKFLEKRGEGIHHICIEVDDLPAILARLGERGVELIDSEPRLGAHGSSVAFIHPKGAHGVLIELVESSSLEGGGY